MSQEEAMHMPDAAAMRVGLRIQKPVTQDLGQLFTWLLIFSLLLLAASFGLLVMEYLEEPLPMWFRSAVNEVVSPFQT